MDLDAALAALVECHGLDAVVERLLARRTGVPWWEAAFLEHYDATGGQQGVAAELAGTTSAVVKTHKARNPAFRLKVAAAAERIHQRAEHAGKRRAAAPRR